MRQPVRCQRTGLWLARYETPDGRVRQAGRFQRKGEAQRAILAATRASWASAGGAGRGNGSVTLRDFFERWPEDFPRHPRTTSTNLERLARYVLPYLPREGDMALTELRRSDLRRVQAALLARGLAKETIDGAFGSLSAMLTDAVDEDLLETNPARGFRVRLNDPRLRPQRSRRERRAITPAEVGRFIAAVEPHWQAVCWAPFLTGARPGELFAMRAEEIDAEHSLLYLHETADRYGRIEAGLKNTHHVHDKQRRGRWTLFPPTLVALVADTAGVLFPTVRGRVWGQRNFYRSVWNPAQRESGTSFTLYDARHTFASRLLAAGLPLVEVAAWMGHSLRAGGAEVNTTSRVYAHATGEHREAALRELERFVAVAEAGSGSCV